MAAGGPDTGGRPGRGLDIAVWALVIAALIGVAAVVAWGLSNIHVTFREADRDDPVAGAERLIPVARAPDRSVPDASPRERPGASRDPDAEGVTRPTWTRLPEPVFPDLAMTRGIGGGVVTLRCEAMASGELGACELLGESPSGAGFAGAALAATREARVEPYSIDGFKTDSRITFTVRFQMEPAR